MSDPTEETLLQEEAPFDIQDLIADVVSREEQTGDDALDEDEVGPSEREGELAEDDPSAADDDEDFEDSDESDEDGDEEPDLEEDEPESEDSPDPEEDEPTAEAKADPRDEEITRLKDLVLQTQQQSQQLIDFVLQQQERGQATQAQQAQAAAKKFDLTEEVAHLALFGGDQDAIKALDPETRAKATQLAQTWTKDHARYALDPSALYAEKIRNYVLEDLRQVVGPVLQQQTQAQAQAVIDRHMGDMDLTGRKRVAEVFQSLNTPSEEALKFSVDYVRKELAEQALAERERKVETSERQKKANRSAAKKVSRQGRRAKSKNKQPRLKPGEDLVEFARRLQT